MNIPGLNDLQKQTQEDVNKFKSSGSSDNGNSAFPVLYPGEEGNLKLRLLYNLKGNIIQRQIVRHDVGKTKVACMQMYGEDCPICNAISQVESIKGEGCGCKAKHKAKNRWICYAQLVDFDGKYALRDKGPKKQDIVTLMYPIQLYKQLSDIVIKSGENLDQLVANNEAKPINIAVTKNAGGFCEYSTSIDAFGTIKSFANETEFENTMGDLPNLKDDFIPEFPNEEIRESAKSASETILAEYLNSNIVGPSDNVAPTNNVAPAASSLSDMSNTSESSTSNGDLPSCYGNRDANSPKCKTCPRETECFADSL